MKSKQNGAFVVFIILALAIRLPVIAKGLTDAEIQTMLQERIDRDKMGVGIVVGIVDERGERVFSHGKMKARGSVNVNGDTLFEIGSITKVFTTLLFQDMVDQGEVKLEDPISKFLPANVKTPSYKQREITLIDLATHTSGLPRLPDSIVTVWYMLWHYNDPYAGFGEKELYKFLSHYRLHREIGTEFEYSNLGMQLLGQVLSLKAGTNYETQVIKRICEPLKMNSTCITLSPELKTRFANGHDDSGKPVKNWSSPLPGDGGLRSSVNDLLKLLSAEMGLAPSSLSEAMKQTQVSRHSTDTAGREVGLGWAIQKNSGFIWHNGATAGYHSWIGFSTKTHNGVVVLANSDDDVDEVGQIIVGVRKYHKVAQIDFNVYDQYIGKYECHLGKEATADKVKGHFIYTVTRTDNQIFVKLSGAQNQPALEILPESETHFFFNPDNAQWTFARNENGVVTQLILRQSSKDYKFAKVNSDSYFVLTGDDKCITRDFAGALADYNHALELNPKNAEAYSARGDARRRIQGDETGAMADYTRALELDPKCADAYSRRGVAREIQGDFPGALADYDNFIRLKPNESAWERLYRQTLLRRLGLPSEEFSKTVATWKDDWTKSIGLFLTGGFDEKVLLEAARKSVGETTVPEQKALASYYIGMVCLSQNDRAGARHWFQKCRAAGIKGDDEYEFAGAELARLDTGARR